MTLGQEEKYDWAVRYKCVMELIEKWGSRFAAICQWESPRILLQEGSDHREGGSIGPKQGEVGGGSEYETLAMETPISHNTLWNTPIYPNTTIS